MNYDDIIVKCEKNYCSIAKKHGYASIKAYASAPDFSSIVKNVIDGLWANQDLMRENCFDIKQYFFVLCSVSFEAGISLVALWQENSSVIENEEELSNILSKPSPFFARKHFQDKYQIDEYELDFFLSALFDEHNKIMKKCNPSSQEEIESLFKVSFESLMQLAITLALL